MYCHLKDCLGSVALHVISVNDNLNNTIPDFFTDVVPSDADEVKNGVHIPGIIHSILLSQYCNFQDLNKEWIISYLIWNHFLTVENALEVTMRVTLQLGLGLNMTNAYHLLSDGVVCSLQIAEHLSHNLFGVASIAHCIQQICRPLSDTHIPLSLGQR